MGALIFNIENNLYQDRFSREKTYEIPFQKGMGYLYIDYEVESYAQEKYEIKISFLSYPENITNNLAIQNLTINLFIENEKITSDNISLSFQQISYTSLYYIIIQEESLVRIEGSAFLCYNYSSNVQFEKIDFSIGVTVISRGEIFYRYHLSLIWIEVLYIASLLIIPLFIIYLSKLICEMASSNKKDKKRTEAYYDYLRTRIDKENDN